MFDVGQKVICVGVDNWMMLHPPLWRRILRMADSTGPKRGSIWTIEAFDDEFEGYLVLAEWPEAYISFDPYCFRPIVDKGLEALRSLIANLPVKQPVEV